TGSRCRASSTPGGRCSGSPCRVTTTNAMSSALSPRSRSSRGARTRSTRPCSGANGKSRWTGLRRRTSRRPEDAPGRNRTCDLALRRRALYPLSYRRVGTTSLAPMQLSARIVPLELAETFVISRGATDAEHVAQVEVRHGDVLGFGEAAPVDYHGETAESALAYL